MMGQSYFLFVISQLHHACPKIAWLELFWCYVETLKRTSFHFWLNFSTFWTKEKTFGCWWDRTQVLLKVTAISFTPFFPRWYPCFYLNRLWHLYTNGCSKLGWLKLAVITIHVNSAVSACNFWHLKLKKGALSLSLLATISVVHV